MRPPFRWAGGKRSLAPTLQKMLPRGVEHDVWVEPFCGAAAMAFHLEPGRCVLTDNNTQLIRALQDLSREDVGDLHARTLVACSTYALDPAGAYAALRESVSRGPLGFPWFWVLSASCFNGLWRINKRGEFNTPWNKKHTLSAPLLTDMVTWRRILRDWDVRAQSWQQTIEEHRRGSGKFLFVDPPYDGGFVAYTADGFGWEQQVELAEALRWVDCPFMATNHNTPRIRELYKWAHIQVVRATRRIAADSTKRGTVEEVVITNYRT